MKKLQLLNGLILGLSILLLFSCLEDALEEIIDDDLINEVLFDDDIKVSIKDAVLTYNESYEGYYNNNIEFSDVNFIKIDENGEEIWDYSVDSSLELNIHLFTKGGDVLTEGVYTFDDYYNPTKDKWFDVIYSFYEDQNNEILFYGETGQIEIKEIDSNSITIEIDAINTESGETMKLHYKGAYKEM